MSLGTTAGLRAADESLRASLARAGASVDLVRASPVRGPRSLVFSDYALARAAAAGAAEAIDARTPRALIYSTTTAALLWPRPGAIRFDATAAGNRPGRHGLWQRPLERRRLRQAPLLVPWSEGGMAEAGARRSDDATLVVPVPVEPSGPLESERDIAAITYGANPAKKGLDRVLEAWARVRRDDELLVVAGTREPIAATGVRSTGLLEPSEYRALLRRARVFVCAPRREDYGLAQLEALADGCALVTTASPGPYAALPIARALDPRLVGDDLGAALRAALDEPASDYGSRAAAALAPFSRAAVDRLVAERLLPRLLEP